LLFASESTLAGTEQQGYCDEDNWTCFGSSSGSGSRFSSGSTVLFRDSIEVKLVVKIIARLLSLIEEEGYWTS